MVIAELHGEIANWVGLQRRAESDRFLTGRHGVVCRRRRQGLVVVGQIGRFGPNGKYWWLLVGRPDEVEDFYVPIGIDQCIVGLEGFQVH